MNDFFKTCVEILTRNRDVKWRKLKCWIYYNFPEVFPVFLISTFLPLLRRFNPAEPVVEKIYNPLEN